MTKLNDRSAVQQLRTKTGLRIRRERLLWGMTQEELADDLGVSSNYLSQIERGNRNLSRKLEDRLCELFHLDRNALHSLEEPSLTGRVSEYNALVPSLRESEIQRLLSSCTAEELQLCGHMIRSVLMYVRHPAAQREQDVDMVAAPAPVSTYGEYMSL